MPCPREVSPVSKRPAPARNSPGTAWSPGDADVSRGSDAGDSHTVHLLEDQPKRIFGFLHPSAVGPRRFRSPKGPSPLRQGLRSCRGSAGLSCPRRRRRPRGLRRSCVGCAGGDQSGPRSGRSASPVVASLSGLHRAWFGGCLPGSLAGSGLAVSATLAGRFDVRDYAAPVDGCPPVRAEVGRVHRTAHNPSRVPLTTRTSRGRSARRACPGCAAIGRHCLRGTS